MVYDKSPCWHSSLLLLVFLWHMILFSASFTPLITNCVDRRFTRNHIVRAVGSGATLDGIERNGNNLFELIKNSKVVNPSSNAVSTALDGLVPTNNDGPLSSVQKMFGVKASNYDYLLVIVMPQLGDFDSAEYAEFLSAIKQDLKENRIALRIIGLGDSTSARKFAEFSGLSLDSIRVDPTGNIHSALNLHRGPNWDVPDIVPSFILEWFADYCGAKESSDGKRDSKAITRSWLNYMAMCAGISAPDTLPEILRGYLGDKEAPERLGANDIVTVPASSEVNDDEPFIRIKGITDVKLGPIEYQSLWKNEKGYQRPAELATVRLRFMVEVLSNFGTYVPDQRYLDFRGATYLFGGDMNDQLVYEHVDTGVLSYSKTMKRPLSFLAPYIGKKALNPLGFGDPANKVKT